MPWPFHFINHSCWPFTAKDKYSNQRSSKTPAPQSSAFGPGQNCTLKQTSWLLQKNKIPFLKKGEYWLHILDPISTSAVSLSLQRPLFWIKNKTYFHLRSFDMNTESRIFSVFAQAGEINMNLNAQLKHSSDNKCPLFLELCLICLKKK